MGLLHARKASCDKIIKPRLSSFLALLELLQLFARIRIFFCCLLTCTQDLCFLVSSKGLDTESTTSRLKREGKSLVFEPATSRSPVPSPLGQASSLEILHVIMHTCAVRARNYERKSTPVKDHLFSVHPSQLLCRLVCARHPFVCMGCTQLWVHVKDPISICRKRVGLTAGGTQTWIHCTQEQEIWVALYYICSLSSGKAAWISGALHWDNKVI